MKPALFLSPSREVENLALGMDYRGFTFAHRGLASATSYAESKDCRTDDDQDLFHDDATHVYPQSFQPVQAIQRLS